MSNEAKTNGVFPPIPLPTRNGTHSNPSPGEQATALGVLGLGTLVGLIGLIRCCKKSCDERRRSAAPDTESKSESAPLNV